MIVGFHKEINVLVEGRALGRSQGAPQGSLGVKMASWTVLGGLRRIFGGVLEATFSVFSEVNLHTV